MNITILERFARKAFGGETVESESMLKSGIITPAEHRSLESLSSQIAANLRVMSNGSSNGVVALKSIDRIWV
jgi:hypothetical protein